MPLEDFIRNNALVPNPGDISGSEYAMKVYNDKHLDGELIVYFHPSGRNGETIYFIVKGNTLTQWFFDKEKMKLNTVKDRFEQETR